MARRRKGRPVDGVLILDKPQGMTSNAALQKVRWLFGAQKAGHTGSLDPLATGVLPICFGEATKFSRYLLDADKGYFTRAKLGEIRDSGDSDGQVVSQSPVPEISDDELESILSKFRGNIEQVPTMFSALKHQGRPLYEYARKGIEIERPSRPVTIFDLFLKERSSDTLTMSVDCSKGTYIRTLVEDIGQELECGAHVEMLRRFKAGHFVLDESTSLEKLIDLEGDHESLDALLLPTDSLLPNLPKIFVNNTLGRSLLHGQAVRIPPSEIQGLVSLYISDGLDEGSEGFQLLESHTDMHNDAKFCGVVEVSEEGEVQPKRLVTFDDNR